MSQHDFDIANQTAPNSRADINLALKALASNSSGTSAPTTTYANMTYYNTATNILYKRNEADSAWITIGTIDETAGTFMPNIGFTPVQQGGGASQLGSKLYLGWDGAQLRFQVDSTDKGRLVSESNFFNMVAQSSTGAVGTYAWLASLSQSTTEFVPNGTYSGSSLRFGGVYGTVQSYGIMGAYGGAISGTWRCMSGLTLGGANETRSTLFLRIA